MAVPAGLSPEVTAYLDDLESRLVQIESPQGFTPAFLTVSTNLTVASAAQFGARWAILTDLKTAAYSTGSHWVRVDTGATII